MRKVVLSLIAVAACLAATYALTAGSSSLRAKLSHPDFSAFNEWQIVHQKVYVDETEMMVRFGIWLAKHHEIMQTNALMLNYTLGHNQFSDMTTTEFVEKVLCQYTMEDESVAPYTHEDLADVEALGDVDWTNKGVVASIKNQGQCGSCWAFSAVAAYESANAQKTGRVSLFSEQEQVDCNHGCYGCNGGWPYKAFQYWQKKGAASESCYRYTARTGSCKTSCAQAGPKVRSYGRASGESSLASAVSRQVVSVGIAANGIMNYHSGIFDGTCGGQINHAVNVVGYGSGYWKLRNSWSTSWGERGYFRIVRGKGKCSIGQDTTYPSL